MDIRSSLKTILFILMGCGLILSYATGQTKGKTEKVETPVHKLDHYMVIAKKNLFIPLGSVREVKRQEFVVTGILGRTALIQIAGQPASYYVTEGESFADGAKLARIEEDSVTIVHEGNKIELKLGKGGPAGGSQSSGKREQNKQMSKQTKPLPGAKAKSMGANAEKRMRKEEEHRQNVKQRINDLYQKRAGVEKKIAEMEAKGHTDENAYQVLEKIDHAVQDLESSID